MSKTRIIIDFWNLQLHWNEYVGNDHSKERIQIPWSNLPAALCEMVADRTGSPAEYRGTHVYASVDPMGNERISSFLNGLRRHTGYSVMIKERKARPGGIRCKDCDTEIERCPKCSQVLKRTVEKGIDAAIITEMIQMAYDGVYDSAVICSADADLGQAIEFIQNRIGKQVFNLWFPGVGMTLRNSCWSHISADDLITKLGMTIPGRP